MDELLADLLRDHIDFDAYPLGDPKDVAREILTDKRWAGFIAAAHRDYWVRGSN